MAIHSLDSKMVQYIMGSLRMGRDMVGASKCILMVRIFKVIGKMMHLMVEAFLFKMMEVGTKANFMMRCAMAMVDINQETKKYYIKGSSKTMYKVDLALKLD